MSDLIDVYGVPDFFIDGFADYYMIDGIVRCTAYRKQRGPDGVERVAVFRLAITPDGVTEARAQAFEVLSRPQLIEHGIGCRKTAH